MSRTATHLRKRNCPPLEQSSELTEGVDQKVTATYGR